MLSIHFEELLSAAKQFQVFVNKFNRIVSTLFCMLVVRDKETNENKRES